jgi:hypothetical protein
MKQAEDSWQQPDPRQRAQPAVPRSPEPETRELDAAEIARLVAQARSKPVPLEQRAHPASARPRPAEPQPSGTVIAPAQPLPRPAAARPPSMPAPPVSGPVPRRDSPPGRAPKGGPGGEDRKVELSDLHARPPKPWSDQAPRRPPADKPAPQLPAERPLPTGSKRWRTPVDPPARDLTLRLSPEAIRAAYPHREKHASQSSPCRPGSASEPLAFKRPELGRRIAIGVLAAVALSMLLLGPRGSITRAADRVGGAMPQAVAPLPAAVGEAPTNLSDRAGITDLAPRPPPIATVVDAEPALPRPRELAAAAPAPRAAERSKPARGEPASRTADSVNPYSSATASAIEQLALGHQREALAAYLRLAAAQPERPAYAAIARILQHKLRLRCTRGDDSFSTACQEASP